MDLGLPLPWGLVPAERLFRVVTGADPPANTEVSVTVPGGAVWEVLTVRLTLVCDANVANRRTSILFDDGTTTFFQQQTTGPVGAGSSTGASFARLLGTTDGATFNIEAHGSLPDLPLLPGFRIRTSTLNLQVGDNYGAPVLYVAEYQLRGIERAVARYREAAREVGEAAAMGPES